MLIRRTVVQIDRYIEVISISTERRVGKDKMLSRNIKIAVWIICDYACGTYHLILSNSTNAVDQQSNIEPQLA